MGTERSHAAPLDPGQPTARALADGTDARRPLSGAPAKQLETDRQRLGGIEKRLMNEDFLTRAKPEAVEKAKSEAEKLRTTLASIEERLAALG